MTSFATLRLFRTSNGFLNNCRWYSLDYPRKFLPNEDHVYGKILTKSYLTQFLIDNVVYNDGNFVVTSKPYGVANNAVIGLPDYFIRRFCPEICLKDVMPDVAAALGFSSLEVVKCPERLASGVTVCCATTYAKKVFSISLLRSLHRQELFNSYVVVTVGQPNRKTWETKFAFQREQRNPDPVILDTWSRRSLRSGLVTCVLWKHTVLSSSKLASLVKVDINSTKHNSLRALLSLKCFSPVLGDHIYGPRVKNVMSVPLMVDNVVRSPKVVQKLPEGLLEALHLTESEQAIIPDMVHLQSLNVNMESNTNFHMCVAPPKSFIWTCKQLGLNVDRLLPWEADVTSHETMQNI